MTFITFANVSMTACESCKWHVFNHGGWHECSLDVLIKMQVFFFGTHLCHWLQIRPHTSPNYCKFQGLFNHFNVLLLAYSKSMHCVCNHFESFHFFYFFIFDNLNLHYYFARISSVNSKHRQLENIGLGDVTIIIIISTIDVISWTKCL
jgi:hypothetical protein